MGDRYYGTYTLDVGKRFSILKYIILLFQVWQFVRFVNKQELKIYEYLTTPEGKADKGGSKTEIGYEPTISAYAKKRRIRRVSEGKVIQICGRACGMRYLVCTSGDNSSSEYRAIIVTDEGATFSESSFGYIQALYIRYPKATAVVFGGLTLVVANQFFHYLGVLGRIILNYI